MRKILFFVCLFLVLATPAMAVVRPQDSLNNKFGMHVATAASEDIANTAKLVNSEGGDWGYITLVIQENDRNREKWQGVFDELRQKHLIPIIRLATNPEGDNWRRASVEKVADWVN